MDPWIDPWVSVPAFAASDDPAIDPPWILLERTACSGSCPNLTLKILRVGKVVFESKRFVHRRCVANPRLAVATLERGFGFFENVSSADGLGIGRYGVD